MVTPRIDPTDAELRDDGYHIPGGRRTVPYEWEFMGKGGSRMVFYHRGYVIKVPCHENSPVGHRGNGEWENEAEAKLYREQKLGIIGGRILAPCRLLANGWLVMRAVRPIHAAEGHHSPAERLPADHRGVHDERYGGLSRKRNGNLYGSGAPGWARYVGDNHQVGVTPSGRWYAYDYALESAKSLTHALTMGGYADSTAPASGVQAKALDSSARVDRAA